MSLLKIFWNTLQLLVWPMNCLCCGEYDKRLCDDCLSALRGELASGASNAKLDNNDLEIDIICIGKYAGNLRKIILAWKDHGRSDFDKMIKNFMGKIAIKWTESALKTQLVCRRRIYIVPLPSSKSSIKHRGFWQTLVLGKTVQRTLELQGLKVKLLPILKQKNVKKQVNYSAEQRASNKRDALYFNNKKLSAISARKHVEYEKMQSSQFTTTLNCIIVDDICTTGATIVTSKKLLESIGFNVIGCLCIAKV